MNWNDAFHAARRLAITSHAKQMYGDRPYGEHLKEVVGVLERFGARLDDEATAPLLVAGWLHDAIEDTGLSRDTVASEFGLRVADLVWRVSDEPGRNRKERKAATYLKLAESEHAIILKLADRIANVEESRRNNPGLLSMYRKEHPVFQDALRDHCVTPMAQRMWETLDGLLPAAQPN